MSAPASDFTQDVVTGGVGCDVLTLCHRPGCHWAHRAPIIRDGGPPLTNALNAGMDAFAVHSCAVEACPGHSPQ